MLVYCDYIMHLIRNRLVESIGDNFAPVQLQRVGVTQFDVNEDGSFKSPTKRLEVMIENKIYIVTVEEKE